MKINEIYTVSQGVIRKHNKTDRVYCKAGDKVKVISFSDPVVIVENVKNKERFAANKVIIAEYDKELKVIVCQQAK